MKYTLATATVLSLLGVMIAPANANNGNVELALQGQGGILSMFYQALVNTGVANELNENMEYTVFAPTNAAFSEIQPRVYPCFYSVQCRGEVAAVLRNHIVPRQENIQYWSTWGPISTIGTRSIRVVEAYKNDYTVDGNKVLHRNEGDEVNLYTIDGVIADDRELAVFRTQPISDTSNTVVQKTVTVRRTSVPSHVRAYRYLVPGGYPASTVIYTDSDEYVTDTDEVQDGNTTRTTTTRTRTTQ
jgi:uncharacterized surface protein with fasciclin (FAS1) repeats